MGTDHRIYSLWLEQHPECWDEAELPLGGASYEPFSRPEPQLGDEDELTTSG